MTYSADEIRIKYEALPDAVKTLIYEKARTSCPDCGARKVGPSWAVAAYEATMDFVPSVSELWESKIRGSDFAPLVADGMGPPIRGGAPLFEGPPIRLRRRLRWPWKR